MKCTSINSVKCYKSNMEVFSDEWEGSLSLSYDEFWDDLCRPVHEWVAREILDDKYNIIGKAADKIIFEMFIYEWIINDDEVYLYLVNTYEAYLEDEKGKRWMLHCPCDTVEYKHEVEEYTTKHLPKGVFYDEDDESFYDGKDDYTLVNEADGSVSLVSAEKIIHWF